MSRQYTVCTSKACDSWIWTDRIAKLPHPCCAKCGKAWPGRTRYVLSSEESSEAPFRLPKRTKERKPGKAARALHTVWGSLTPEARAAIEDAGWKPPQESVLPASPPGLGEMDVDVDDAANEDARQKLWHGVSSEQKELMVKAGLRPPEQKIPAPTPYEEGTAANAAYRKATVALKILGDRKLSLQKRIDQAKEQYQARLSEMKLLQEKIDEAQQKVNDAGKELTTKVLAHDESLGSEVSQFLEKFGISLTEEQEAQIIKARFAIKRPPDSQVTEDKPDKQDEPPPPEEPKRPKTASQEQRGTRSSVHVALLRFRLYTSAGRAQQQYRFVAIACVLPKVQAFVKACGRVITQGDDKEVQECCESEALVVSRANFDTVADDGAVSGVPGLRNCISRRTQEEEVVTGWRCKRQEEAGEIDSQNQLTASVEATGFTPDILLAMLVRVVAKSSPGAYPNASLASLEVAALIEGAIVHGCSAFEPRFLELAEMIERQACENSLEWWLGSHLLSCAESSTSPAWAKPAALDLLSRQNGTAPTKVRIFSANITCWGPKIKDWVLTSIGSWDLLCIQETHLLKDIPNVEAALSSAALSHHFGPGQCSGKGGVLGGVLTVAPSHRNVRRVVEVMKEGCGFVGDELRLQGWSVVIFNVYLKSGSSLQGEINSEVLSQFLSLVNGLSVMWIAIGDFNIPAEEFASTSFPSEAKAELVSTQQPTTDHGATLDYALVSRELRGTTDISVCWDVPFKPHCCSYAWTSDTLSAMARQHARSLPALDFTAAKKLNTLGKEYWGPLVRPRHTSCKWVLTLLICQRGIAQGNSSIVPGRCLLLGGTFFWNATFGNPDTVQLEADSAEECTGVWATEQVIRADGLIFSTDASGGPFSK
ncbi:unnamed protein product, partial [Symbiodinium microadriaticum]